MAKTELIWREGFLVCLLLASAFCDPKGLLADTKGEMTASPIKEYQLPEGLSSPGSLTVDTTGKVWFAEKVGKSLSVFDPEKEEFQVYALPESWGNIGPATITHGPEGDL